MAEEELELVEPDYIQEFACLAGDCPDTCCANWEIAFDEAACARYATAGADADVAAGCRAAVKRNTEPVADGTVPYAFVTLTPEQRCAFLLPDDCCLIQRRTSERNLPRTCRTYPRVWHRWGAGYAECSMDVSCPLAARLILDRHSSLRFSTRRLAAAELAGYRLARVEKAEDTIGRQLRNFLIFLLQQQSFTVEERLLLANRFFWAAVAAPGRASTALVDRYLGLLEKPETVRARLSEGEPQRAMQLDVVRILLGHRLQMPDAPVSEGFAAAAGRCRQRWELSAERPVTQGNVRLYSEDLRVWEQFAVRHTYMGENYLVNQVFKQLCFAGQGADEQRWLELIYEFAAGRALLAAAAGEAASAGRELGLPAAITLLQQAARSIEHNEAYLQQVAKFITVLQMNQRDGMEALIRSR